ncbi:MAG: hypothetical protein IPH43_11295 [Xanthomonadales bacterium]|nr:hypothetical protein [Xanthomonadales bacterium]
MFTSYGGGVAVGDQPLSFNPTAMRDPVNRVPCCLPVSKYLGKPDRTGNIPRQAYVWGSGIMELQVALALPARYPSAGGLENQS